MKSKIVFASLLLAVALVSCGKTGQSAAPGQNDSIVLNIGNKSDSVRVYIDKPNTGSLLTDTLIAEYINETLGGDYTGSLQDLDSLANFYAQSRLDSLKKYHEGGQPDMLYVNEFEARKIFENKKVVSYEINSYDFEGGAHGSASSFGCTFRKSDGRRLGREILKDNYDENWEKMYNGALKKYLEVSSDQELFSALFVEGGIIPAPQMEPYFTKEGLRFVYQQYEIGPYAIGMPEVVIPYAKLKPYLKANVQGLFY